MVYRSIGSYADEYPARLSAECPDTPPLAGAYHWDAAKGRVFLYREVAHDLAARLSAGAWEGGGFLPLAAGLRLPSFFSGSHRHTAAPSKFAV